jgi:hypothetical protein
MGKIFDKKFNLYPTEKTGTKELEAFLDTLELNNMFEVQFAYFALYHTHKLIPKGTRYLGAATLDRLYNYPFGKLTNEPSLQEKEKRIALWHRHFAYLYFATQRNTEELGAGEMAQCYGNSRFLGLGEEVKEGGITEKQLERLLSGLSETQMYANSGGAFQFTLMNYMDVPIDVKQLSLKELLGDRINVFPPQARVKGKAKAALKKICNKYDKIFQARLGPLEELVITVPMYYLVDSDYIGDVKFKTNNKPDFPLITAHLKTDLHRSHYITDNYASETIVGFGNSVVIREPKEINKEEYNEKCEEALAGLKSKNADERFIAFQRAKGLPEEFREKYKTLLSKAKDDTRNTWPTVIQTAPRKYRDEKMETSYIDYILFSSGFDEDYADSKTTLSEMNKIYAAPNGAFEFKIKSYSYPCAGEFYRKYFAVEPIEEEDEAIGLAYNYWTDEFMSNSFLLGDDTVIKKNKQFLGKTVAQVTSHYLARNENNIFAKKCSKKMTAEDVRKWRLYYTLLNQHICRANLLELGLVKAEAKPIDIAGSTVAMQLKYTNTSKEKIELFFKEPDFIGITKLTVGNTPSPLALTKKQKPERILLNPGEAVSRVTSLKRFDLKLTETKQLKLAVNAYARVMIDDIIIEMPEPFGSRVVANFEITANPLKSTPEVQAALCAQVTKLLLSDKVYNKHIGVALFPYLHGKTAESIGLRAFKVRSDLKELDSRTKWNIITKAEK